MDISLHSSPGKFNFSKLQALPRQVLDKDWSGKNITPPVEFSFAMDNEHLWFLASRDKPALAHPSGLAGMFQPELWMYDVAEWFLHNTATGQYWEFNLSPSGAWWSCGFSSPRQADNSLPLFRDVITQSIMTGERWTAMACIPLDCLYPVIKECSEIISAPLKLAATFILESPQQIFLTTANSQDGEPDFHRPNTFGSINITSL